MKNGISLIILVITIVVLGILVGIVAMPGSDVLNKSKLASFYEDITKIQDAVTAYKITRGHLPIKDNSQALNYDQVLDLVSNEQISFLNREIVSNADNNSEFYYIDINKIGLENVSYGINDTNLISNSEGTRVYFLEGFYLNDVWYFSVGMDI